MSLNCFIYWDLMSGGFMVIFGIIEAADLQHSLGFHVTVDDKYSSIALKISWSLWGGTGGERRLYG